MGVTSVRLQPEIENPLEEQRWTETLEAINSVKSGKLIEEKEVIDWLESWGTENEIEPPSL